jgi:type II protein arginine methyltransferase
MSQLDISCGLEYPIVPDLQGCLTEALRCSYTFIVAPIVHPRFRRQHTGQNSGNSGGFTRSDMVLAPQDWTTRIVGKLSPYLNVDSVVPSVQQHHEDSLREELNYCRGLGLPAVILRMSGEKNNNLARIVQSYFESW